MGPVKKMDKRADISITILVLGIVAICFLTILNFINSSDEVENGFVGPGLIETINSVAQVNNFISHSDFDSELKNGLRGHNLRVPEDGFDRTTEIKVEGTKITGTYIAEQNIFLRGKVKRELINIVYTPIK